MREIKFRAYEPERKEMFSVLSMGLSDLNGRKPLIEINNGYFTIWKDVSELELMQYTGLKDKNGKEIYEGDIILYRDVVNVNHRCEVKFIDGCFDVVYLGVIKRDYLKVITCNHTAEVIGNIYENPELLK